MTLTLLKTITYFSLFLLLVSSHQIITFDEFIEKFEKPYRKGSEEYAQKKKIFIQNVEELRAMDCQSCGVTKFFDVPSKSFEDKMLTLQQKLNPIQSKFPTTPEGLAKVAAPLQVDWRKYGVITSIKNQLKCGCCWSFATTAVTQSFLIMNNNADPNIDLSEQYLLRCTADSDCQGGYIQRTLKNILNNGIPADKNYPYDPFGSQEVKCLEKQNNFKVQNAILESFYHLNNQEIKTLLMQGPLAIGLDSANWQKYAGGIWKCKPDGKVNHAVVLVGYTQNYWIVKNQWGNDWGQKGYIYISMKESENCKMGKSVHRLVLEKKPSSLRKSSVQSMSKLRSSNFQSIQRVFVFFVLIVFIFF